MAGAAVGAVVFARILTTQHVSAWAAACIGALIVAGAWLGTLYPFTEVSSSGLRTRSLLRTRRFAWADVRAVEAVTQKTRAGEVRRAAITSREYGLVSLGAPFEAGDRAHADFEAELATVRTAWRVATKSSPPARRLEARRITRPPRPSHQRAAVVVLVVAVAGLVALTHASRPVWDAHLGHGTRGTFTVTFAQCGKSCTYFGDFAGAGSEDTRLGVKLSGGPKLQAGDQVAAIDSGGSDNVYARGTSIWFWMAVGQAGLGLVLGFCAARPVADLLRRRREAQLAAV